MNQLQIFNHRDFGSVEIIEEEGKFYFGATQTAKVLKYSNPHDAIGRHCRQDGVVKREVTDSLGRKQEMNFIDEGNLYRLVVKSKLPEAEKFEVWVFDELIPGIRKNGKYELVNKENVVDIESKRMAAEAKLKNADARLMNAKTKRFDLIMSTVEKIPELGPEAKQQLVSYGMLILTDKLMIEPPKVEKYYTAKEIGDEMGISHVMVGKIANKFGLKVESYGYMILGKSQYSDKQVSQWVYTEAGRLAVIEAYRGKASGE